MARSGALKLVSWNVNGIRAVFKKGLFDWIRRESPDVVCFQEIKAQTHLLPPELLHPIGYEASWNPAERPGYSGVATWSKVRPLAVQKGLGDPRFDAEGRVLQSEFEDFYLLNIYFPNGQRSAERLRYKLDFYEATLERLKKLKKSGKGVLLCGDVNTAHQPLDLARPRENADVSGFLPEERAWIDRLIAGGFEDTFRRFNKDGGNYTWWDQLSRARERNVGWRIDYFFASEVLRPRIEEAFIQADVMGSDHCPVGVIISKNEI